MIDPMYLYDIATDPRLRGWELDLRYMVIDYDLSWVVDDWQKLIPDTMFDDYFQQLIVIYN